MEEIDLGTVKNRAVSGVVVLTGRTFLVQIISFVGFFFLTIFLGRADIGLFFAISEIVAILGYFSDIGLAAALIQKKEKPLTRDIRSTFTIQQALVVSLILLVFLFTPQIVSFFNLGQSGKFLLWSLTIGFFLASLKTIPSVLLERNLKFDLLIFIELVETLLFYGIAVLLAWKGWGIISYAWAVLARGVAGVAIIYILSPWPVGFAIETDSLRRLLKFGVPYQANTFLAVIKDRFMNVLLLKIVGADGVGILGWAQKWSQMPLRLAMDSVMRVTFPAYSRMQENKAELIRSIEKTLFFISFLIFPMLAGIVVISGPLVSLIPQYGKWEVALVALYFYLINSAWGAVTTPLTNALSAVGRIKTVFKLMIMWTALTWILFPVMALKFGYNGVAAASALVAISSLTAIYLAQRYLSFNFWGSINKPFFASLLMGVVVYGLLILLPNNIIGLALSAFMGGLFYLLLIIVLVGNEFVSDFRKIILNLKPA